MISDFHSLVYRHKWEALKQTWAPTNLPAT